MATGRYSLSRNVGGRNVAVTCTARPIAYASTVDGTVDTPIDLTIARITGGFRCQGADWHFDFADTGAVALGARKGANEFRYRIVDYGYLRVSTGEWLPIEAADYAASTPIVTRSGITGSGFAGTIYNASEVRRTGLFSSNLGNITAVWKIDGHGQKHALEFDTAAATWLRADRSLAWVRTFWPLVPATDIRLCMRLAMDWSDIPRLRVDGVEQDLSGNYDLRESDGLISLEDAEGRELLTLPRDHAYGFSPAIDRPTRRQPVVLDRRIWRDGTRHWMTIGLLLDEFMALPVGPFELDPSFGETMDGEQNTTTTFTTTLAYAYDRPLASSGEWPASQHDLSAEGIPNGATVSAATMSWTRVADIGGSTDVQMTLFLENELNPTDWSNSNLPSGASEIGTGESFDINRISDTSVYTTSDSGNFAAALQSLFALGGWPGSASEEVNIWTEYRVDNASWQGLADNSSQLDLTYSAGGGGGGSSLLTLLGTG